MTAGARGGWFPGSRAPILMQMRLLPRSARPIEAAGDLGSFFRARRARDLLMIVPALGITAAIVYGLFVEYNIPKPYQRNIIYVESWPLSRTDADIRAAQRIDINTKKLALVQPKVEKVQRMLQFRKVDAWITAHGF
jgi:hypothetical protein